jgi:hypothetical protein
MIFFSKKTSFFPLFNENMGTVVNIQKKYLVLFLKK